MPNRSNWSTVDFREWSTAHTDERSMVDFPLWINPLRPPIPYMPNKTAEDKEKIDNESTQTCII